MRIWKTWIVPILKGLAVAIIAIALVKIAFFPDRAEDSAAVPTGSITETTVQPQKGSIVNTLSIDGKVTQERAVEGRVPMAGVVQDVFVQAGATVQYGATIASIKQTTERPPIQNADGSTTERAPEVSWSEVTAPATGTVTSLTVISSQTVAVGEVVVQVTPSQLIVSGTIPAVQQYRLSEKPADAQVTITNGPAPFTCTDLKIGELPTTTGSGNGAGGGAGGSTGSNTGSGAPGTDSSSGTTPVTCRIPAEVQAFAGVEAKMTIEGGRVDDVLTLPVTAVSGQTGTGVVTVVAADGTRSERTIGLGLTDGTRVQVTEGLSESDTVLEFVPSKPRATSGGECQFDPMTGGCIDMGGSGGGSVEDVPQDDTSGGDSSS